MKSLSGIFFCGAAILGAAVLFPSCEGDPGGGGPVVVGNSIYVSNEVGAETTMTLEFESSWQVNNDIAWFSVSPQSGEAGTAEITVSVLDINPDLRERLGTFVIESGGESTQYYVVQDVTPGFLLSDMSFSGRENTEYVLSFDANVGNISIASEEDWISFGEITTENNLLEDGSLSKYATYSVVVSLSENSGDAARSAVVNINGETASIQRTFTQVPYMGEDFTRDFLRRSLAVRITSTSCGYCPMMNEALRMASEETPNRFVIMNVYGQMGYNDSFIFGQVRELMNQFGAGGYPFGLVNYYASVPNYSNVQTTKQAFVDCANEAVEQLPSNTAIIGSASIESNEIVITAYVASKSAGDYFINAFLCEDGLVAYQADYVNGNNSKYEHNNVTISAVSALFGDPVSLLAEGMREVTYRFAIPSSVKNKDNLHVVMFTTYEGEFNSSITTTESVDAGYVVDNVVAIPVNGTEITFEYEN